MNTVELLAPAKNYETAISAINCGADAIYIGAPSFGARQNAKNSIEDIEKVVKYAHLFNVKVHVTINTILNNDELEKAIKLVQTLYNIGVDAIIVQDMGLIKASIDGKLSPIELHASTQCDNRTLEKAKFFDTLGLSRVILARELSLEKIKDIVDNVSCEVETFIHGALCVSYSGQCYLSYINGGRSANRGECAQPCRKKYSIVDDKGKYILKDKYLLSLKDFNASDSLKTLVNIGVKSFKIEGRLKDVNYVKNVTLFYNNELNKYANRTSSGKVYTEIEPNIYKTFNRGYTTYFLNDREQCYNFLSPKSRGEKLGKIINVTKNYFEIDADISAQDGLCFIKNGEMLGCLVNKVEGHKIYPNSTKNLEKGMMLYRNFDAKFDKVLNNVKICRKIAVNIEIDDNYITAVDEDKNIAKIQLPIGEEAKNIEKLKETYLTQLNKTGKSPYIIEKIDILTNKLSFVPVSQINNLRRNLFDELSKIRLSNYKRKVQKPIKYTTYEQKNLDFRGNIFNDEALQFYTKCGCEKCNFALESSNYIPSGIELMRTKHCLKYSAGYCGKGIKQWYLEDGKGQKYPLKFDCKNCEMVILSK